jgi:hypothetical protein
MLREEHGLSVFTGRAGMENICNKEGEVHKTCRYYQRPQKNSAACNYLLLESLWIPNTKQSESFKQSIRTEWSTTGQLTFSLALQETKWKHIYMLHDHSPRGVGVEKSEGWGRMETGSVQAEA